VQRTGIQLELESPGLTKVKAGGQLFLTTVRICFVPEKPTAAFAALDIPLQGLSEVWINRKTCKQCTYA
jgi:hypothetical protein